MNERIEAERRRQTEEIREMIEVCVKGVFEEEQRKRDEGKRQREEEERKEAEEKAKQEEEEKKKREEEKREERKKKQKERKKKRQETDQRKQRKQYVHLQTQSTDRNLYAGRCFFDKKGHCRKGDSCPYKHGKSFIIINSHGVK